MIKCSFSHFFSSIELRDELNLVIPGSSLRKHKYINNMEDFGDPAGIIAREGHDDAETSPTDAVQPEYSFWGNVWLFITAHSEYVRQSDLTTRLATKKKGEIELKRLKTIINKYYTRISKDDEEIDNYNKQIYIIVQKVKSKTKPNSPERKIRLEALQKDGMFNALRSEVMRKLSEQKAHEKQLKTYSDRRDALQQYMLMLEEVLAHMEHTPDYVGVMSEITHSIQLPSSVLNKTHDLLDKTLMETDLLQDQSVEVATFNDKVGGIVTSSIGDTTMSRPTTNYLEAEFNKMYNDILADDEPEQDYYEQPKLQSSNRQSSSRQSNMSNNSSNMNNRYMVGESDTSVSSTTSSSRKSQRVPVVVDYNR
jgi:hypothetical protein